MTQFDKSNILYYVGTVPLGEWGGDDACVRYKGANRMKVRCAEAVCVGNALKMQGITDYEELIQIGIFLVALIGLVYKISHKDKK